jgi:hypothetical protein
MNKKQEGTSIHNKTTSLRAGFLVLFSSTLFTACSNSQGYQVVSGTGSVQSTGQSTTSPTITNPTSTTGSTSSGSQSGSVFSSGYAPQALAWESSSHPERLEWSTSLYGIVNEHFAALDKAKDISNFCPSYSSLSKDQKINLWAELFASDAYYESSWDPTEYSVDVGTQNDKDTWSVGLLQMSVIDQQSYNLSLGYDFADLQTADKNLELGVTIMALQVAKYGTVLIDVGSPGLYWSTLHPGGEYDQSAAIEKTTKSLNFCH